MNIWYICLPLRLFIPASIWFCNRPILITTLSYLFTYVDTTCIYLLPLCLPIGLFVSLFAYWSNLCACLSVYPAIYPSIYLCQLEMQTYRTPCQRLAAGDALVIKLVEHEWYQFIECPSTSTAGPFWDICWHWSCASTIFMLIIRAKNWSPTKQNQNHDQSWGMVDDGSLFRSQHASTGV